MHMHSFRRLSPVFLHSRLKNASILQARFEYDWAKIEKSKSEFGRDISNAIANCFWSNIHDEFGIFYRHRDYCGHGMIWSNNHLVICEFNEGFMSGKPLMRWNSSEKRNFIDWLSIQSDFSLSGHDKGNSAFFEEDLFFRGNQKLTLERFKEFLSEQEKQKQ